MKTASDWAVYVANCVMANPLDSDHSAREEGSRAMERVPAELVPEVRRLLEKLVNGPIPTTTMYNSRYKTRKK